MNNLKIRSWFSFFIGIILIVLMIYVLIDIPHLYNENPWKWLGSLIIGIINIYISVSRVQTVESGEADRYTDVIFQISSIEDQLKSLSKFLNKERKKVTETEKTVLALEKEQEKLAPIVDSNRDLVEAILSAHSERQKSSIWRERLIGFSLGIAGSLIATMVYELFSNT